MRLHKRSAADSDVTPAEETPVGTPNTTPERTIDLLMFYLGFYAYSRYIEEKKQDPRRDQVWLMGRNYARRFLSSAVAGLEENIVSKLQLETRDRVLLKPYTLATRPGAMQPFFIGVFAQLSLPWLFRHGLLDDAFPSRALTNARAVYSTLGDVRNRAAVLHQLSDIASISGLMPIAKWLDDAAAAVGAPLTKTDQTLKQGRVATDLAERLRHIQLRLTGTDANTPQRAELLEAKAQIIEKIKEVAAESPDSKAVMAAAIAVVSKPVEAHRTETARKNSLNSEQEDALIAEGPTVIAASAGSGKTRVLAAKVVYHVMESNPRFDPSQIMAVSFTNKAAAELANRVRAYGLPLDPKLERRQYTTIHKTVGALLTSAPGHKRAGYIGQKDAWKLRNIVKLAIAQAELAPSGTLRRPVGSQTDLFARNLSGAETVSQAPPVQARPGPGGATQRITSNQQLWQALTQAIPVLKDRNKGWHAGFFSDLIGRRTTLDRLTSRQLEFVNQGLDFARSAVRVASVEEDEGAIDDAIEQRLQKMPKLKEMQYYNQPANMWFNLGRKLKSASGQDEPISASECMAYIGQMKGAGTAPYAAWEKTRDPLAAVYGAYEWLKSNQGEPSLRGIGDLSDLIIDGTRALLHDPNLRARVQQQYRVVMVDEAQDLDSVQHLFFGLVTGTYDPATRALYDKATLVEKHRRGEMANTYALIGDDKQAIYEWRSAKPEEFINKSTSGIFQTKMLRTNYRSGKKILEAANKLIAHNKGQIPLECRPRPDAGEGAIITRTYDVDGYDAATAETAKDIKEQVSQGEKKYTHFGIGVRTRSEAYEFCMKLLEQGVPFKSNANLFSDPIAKALIGWLTIADPGSHGNTAVMNEAFLESTVIPNLYLGRTLPDGLQQHAKGLNYITWLSNPDSIYRIYSQPRQQQALKHHLENIHRVMSISGGSPRELLNAIFQLKGPNGSSAEEAMIQQVLEDSTKMAELAAEAEGGIPSHDDIKEAAFAPVRSLIKLTEEAADLHGTVSYIQQLKNVNARVSSRDDAQNIERDAVTVSTIHGWKGLEKPVMYIAMAGGRFPSNRSDVQAERRLAYVAVTRAEEKAILLDIPRKVKKEVLHSQFLQELCVPVDTQKGQGKTASVQEEPWDDDAEARRILASEASTIETLWGETLR